MRHKLILPILLALFVAGCGSTTVNVTTPATKPSAPEKFGAVQNSIPLSQKGAANGVATLNGSIRLTETQLPTNVLLTSSEQAIPAWVPSTLYAEGAEVIHEHVLYWAKAEHTSGLTFNAENWERGLALTEKGATNGVAELDGKGLLPELELPASAVVAKEKALGEVEGTVTLNLEEGTTFTATLKKNVTFKVTKTSARPSEVTLILTENGTGGWTWTVEGASWVNSEPIFTTTKGTKNFESLVVDKSGGEIIALAGTEGKEGKEGPKGSTGPEGPAGASASLLPTWMPVTAKGSPIPQGFGTIGAANEALCVRMMPFYKTGTLKNVSVAGGGTANGKTRVAIFDTGQASSGKYTLLWESAEVEFAGTAWNSMGEPALSVTAGKEDMACIMNSGTTQTIGETNAAPAAAYTQKLPASYLVGPDEPKLIGFHKYSELKYASLTEAELEVGTAKKGYEIIGRIE